MFRRCPPAAWLLLGVTATLFSGCGLFEDQASPPTSGSKPTTANRPTPLAAAEPEVLDAGAAPRQELRLRLTQGAKATIALTVDLNVTQQSAGTDQALNGPPVTETIEFTVGKVQGDHAEISFRFADVAVDRTGSGLTDAEYLTVTADTQALIGLGGRGQVTDRGVFSNLTYDHSPDLDPAVQASLRQFEGQVDTLTPTLPEEPLGVGARWQATDTITASGISVDQVTTYEVTELTAEQVSYTAVVKQSAAAQDADLADLPVGTTARLLSADLTGSTTGTHSFTGLIASGISTLKGVQVIDLSQGKVAPVRLNQRLDLTIIVRSAD